MNQIKINSIDFFENSLKFNYILKRIDFIKWKIIANLRSRIYLNQGNVNRVIWIDPKQIKKVGIGWGKYNRLNEMGKVKDGDWDLNTMDFEELDIYTSFKDRFIGKKQWNETSYYSTTRNRIINGESPWKMKSLSDFEERLKNLDLLFKNIKSNGYASQQQLIKSSGLKKSKDEITVRIGRFGELIFENGRHRLSIAKILSISKVPVIITWRHKKWNKFQLLLNKFKNKSETDCLFPEIQNPDIEIPTNRIDYKYQIIKTNLQFEGGTLLDIGANLGYYCHKFENDGFKCFAIEWDEDKFTLLNEYKIISKKNFTAIKSEKFELIEKTRFDVVLAFNVFHYGLNDSESFNKMELYLKHLKVKTIFFDLSFPKHSKKEVNNNLSIDEFIKFLCNNTGLTEWKCISDPTSINPLYKIY